MSGSVLGGLKSPLRKVADRYPKLRGPIGRTWNTYERLRFTYHCWRNAKAYSTEVVPIDPYQLYELPPDHINRHSPGSFDSISDTGRVIGGEWDLDDSVAFEDRFRYPSFQQRFLKGKPWEDTEFYQTKLEKIHSDRQAKYASVEALERKCAELDRMYEEIKTDGYRTQEELNTVGGSAGSIVGDGGRGFLPGSAHLVRNEISVDIARDGEPMLNEGRHRTCIVKLLELETVPVRIVVRHREWQDLRNRIARYVESRDFESQPEAMAAVDDEILATEDVTMGVEHPDLRTVIDDHGVDKSSKRTGLGS